MLKVKIEFNIKTESKTNKFNIRIIFIKLVLSSISALNFECFGICISILLKIEICDVIHV